MPSDKTNSYTAANAFPVKFFRNITKCMPNGNIIPYHAQVSITNRCNLSCEFCSCANRGDETDMPLYDVCLLFARLAAFGCKALTITGGGEPTLHPDFSKIIAMSKQMGMSIGLVTNGLLLGNVGQELSDCKWVRVSVSDKRNINTLLRVVDKSVRSNRDVDWAFSYVLTAEADLDKLAQIIILANKLEFTHVRVVSDLLDLDNIPDMNDVKYIMQKKYGLDDGRVIYQGRKQHTRGAKRCWISLLKPLFSTDGKMYPCCGVQYAMDPPALDFDKRMVMGNRYLWKTRVLEQIPFDGSNCTRCYYDDYNQAVELMKSSLEHEDFV